jgi:hypothetical protein
MSYFKMRQAQMYRNEAGDGTEGGAGGGGSSVDVNDPKIQALLQAEVEKTVAGLKKKNQELIEKEKKHREQLSQFEGVDVEKFKTLQKQIETNEEMRLLSEGKTEEVVARRVEAMKRDYDAQIAAREAKMSEYEVTLKKKEEKLAELVIDGQLREAYVALDFEPSALDFVLMQGRQVFIMDESGKAVPRDDHGNLIFGKDGKTPISAREYLEGLADKKSFLRKPSKGAGASPNNRSSSGLDPSKMSSTQKIAEGLKQRATA